ncbi:putative Co/Zn/Cd efflux system membrane fusion protein [Acidisarcina polymorpha]|uniref:Putative Co/Zn/Cd efflux system membrane fusion protein n=1 Tax=Acidisarcina polymorpha TaxID=2211140 RepID=A0A2Z5G9J7_9BACT|nr:putative Co/Zn/Cd efflux system membrane fusion protein [Acidisarcina polymorpha]
MKHHGILSLLKYVLFGAPLCLPLTSCTRVAAKAKPAATEAVPVRAVRAVSEDVPVDIAAVGNVEAMERVEVKSRVPGQINLVAFVEGQNVTKGQLLFTIDRETLERQTLEEQANFERDAAMEEQARAVVARDTAAEKQSHSEADVARRLGTLGVISGQRVDQLVTASETAGAAQRADQAAVEAAAGTIRADRARLAETQLQLHFTDVVAPISGRAGAVTVKTGNMVRDNDTTLVTLLQLAPIYVTFGIPEQSLPEVRRLNAAGQLTVNASLDAAAGSAAGMEGHLAFIDNTVDATTGTIRLKAVFLNADNALWPGEYINVRFRLGVEAGRTVVPESSIQDGLDGKYVWLVKSGKASIAPVTVLRTYRPTTGPEEAIIGGGIKPGDVVVTEGQLRLTAGATVTLLDASHSQPPASKPTVTP